PIPPDVFARHEAHVRIKNKWCVGRRCNAFSHPTAKNIGGGKLPLKSVIVANSGEVPGKNTWNICPLPRRSSPPGIGFGSATSGEARRPLGMARPAARVIPACKKLRRETAAARRQKWLWPREAVRRA